VVNHNYENMKALYY